VRNKPLLDRYARLAENSTGVKRVGWLDRLQQAVQFEVLLDVQMPSTAAVLDAGCGTGDLLAALERQGFRGHYTGLDLLPAFVAEAAHRFAARPETSFATADLFTDELLEHDFVLASGLFDYKVDANDVDRWQTIIHRLFDAAQLALVWNGYYQLPSEREDMWAVPLTEVIDLCQRLSPFWRLRADYAPGHYTAFLYRRAYWLTPALQQLIGRLFLDRTLIGQLQNEPYVFADHYGLTMQQLNLLSALTGADEI
jgi:SAM-dependent methyltransferase